MTHEQRTNGDDQAAEAREVESDLKADDERTNPDPVPTREDDLRAAVLKVDGLRKALAYDVGYMKSETELFNKNYAGVLARVDALKKSVAEQEEVLRQLAVLHFEQTGSENKAVTPGVTITQKVDISYDPALAIRWAIHNNVEGVLKLNKPEFDKVAGSAMRPDFVNVEEGPAARLAKDLGKAVAEAE